MTALPLRGSFEGCEPALWSGPRCRSGRPPPRVGDLTLSSPPGRPRRRTECAERPPGQPWIYHRRAPPAARPTGKNPIANATWPGTGTTQRPNFGSRAAPANRRTRWRAGRATRRFWTDASWWEGGQPVSPTGGSTKPLDVNSGPLLRPPGPARRRDDRLAFCPGDLVGRGIWWTMVGSLSGR